MISGVQNTEDVKTAVAEGAAAIGFLVGQRRSGGNFILPSTADRLAEGLPPMITPVLITQFDEVDEIVDIVNRTGISAIQFSGLTPEKVALLKEKIPRTAKLIPEIGNGDFLPGFAMAHVGEFIGMVNAFALKINQPDRAGEMPEIIKALHLPVIVSGCSADTALAAGAYAFDSIAETAEQ